MRFGGCECVLKHVIKAPDLVAIRDDCDEALHRGAVYPVIFHPLEMSSHHVRILCRVQGDMRSVGPLQARFTKIFRIHQPQRRQEIDRQMIRVLCVVEKPV